MMFEDCKKESKLVLVTALLVLIMLLLLPALHVSIATLSLIGMIGVMAVFAMSYNLLLGYTGIVSLGHALFFGSGAYAVAILMKTLGPSLWSLILGIIVAIVIALVAGFVTGYLSLRVKDIYYAMITMAFAQLFLIVGEKWRSVTGGMDGMAVRLPEFLQNRVTTYYIVVVFVIVMFLVLRQFINSPTGRVLVAIRENELRAEALGFDVLRYKLISNITAGVVASLAGVVFALTNRFVRVGVLGVDKTLEALLMTIVGGVGTLFGPILGSTVIYLAREWLSGLSSVSVLFERWYILFGLLYICIVLFMPFGVMGGYNKLKARIKTRRQSSDKNKGLVRAD